jgi:hypothetical protein
LEGLKHQEWCSFRFIEMAKLSGVWDSVLVKPPKMKSVANNGWACPEWSRVFQFAWYTGTPVERMNQIEADYLKHFKHIHSGEETSEAAARIAREAIVH